MIAEGLERVLPSDHGVDPGGAGRIKAEFQQPAGDVEAQQQQEADDEPPPEHEQAQHAERQERRGLVSQQSQTGTGELYGSAPAGLVEIQHREQGEAQNQNLRFRGPAYGGGEHSSRVNSRSFGYGQIYPFSK